MSKNGSVTFNLDEGIGTLSFHHPKGNALPGRLLNQLTERVQEAGQNPEVRVVVLRSQGEGAFCGGAFFDELLGLSDAEEGKDFFMGFARLINAMRSCPKLIIARVQGKAVGGGVGLAAVADYVLAHQSASIKLSELSIGIGPFVIEPVVSRAIGKTAFAHLAINATKWQTAPWAKERGLYAQIHETLEDLDQAVNNLADELSQSNPLATKELKKVLWDGTAHWPELLEERAATSGKLALSDYTQTFLRKMRKQK